MSNKVKVCRKCKIVLTNENHYKGQTDLLCKTHQRESLKDYKKIYQPKYAKTPKGKSALKKASRKAYKNHKEKWIARAKAQYAIKKGIIIKPKRCEVCEQIKPLQGHHEDYTKPLEVIFLCYSCHAEADKLLEFKKSSYDQSN